MMQEERKHLKVHFTSKAVAALCEALSLTGSFIMTLKSVMKREITWKKCFSCLTSLLLKSQSAALTHLPLDPTCEEFDPTNTLPISLSISLPVVCVCSTETSHS